MKILIVTNLYPPITAGGYEISCQETADELGRRGHTIFVLTSKWGGETNRTQGNVRRLLFNNPLSNLNELTNGDRFRLHRRYYQFQWAFKNRKNYKISRELIENLRPDLVFFWNMGSIGITSILAAQDFKIPAVFSIGDYWLLNLRNEHDEKNSYIKKRFRAMIDGLGDFSQLDLRNLLIISKGLKQAYTEKGFSEGDFTVIPRGIQSSMVLPINDLQDLPRNHNFNLNLLFVGRITPDKAPDVAINAINILRKDYGIGNIKLDIIGQGSKEYILSLKNMISELKLEEYIRFLDWVEHSSLLGLYSNYDALLFPSRWIEPLGKTVLEAMARGLPVIASRRGGPLEIIQDGENGLLVPVDDPAAIAGAILQLFLSDNLTQKIRIAGIKTIKDRYTLEHIVDQILYYFQGVLTKI